MIPFDYVRAGSVEEAIRFGAEPRTRFIAGGTNLVDLMKETVERPERLVDIGRLNLAGIEERPNGGVRLGALAPNADTAYNPIVQRDYPLLSSAILAGASPQLRNAATNGGNLNQRTRCYYFYDVATPCNKRERGSGCSAIGGVNRNHAILGTSESCIATHPSDMCVALAALDAVVQVIGPAGERKIAFVDFHRLPGDEPQTDNTLAAGELVTAIDLPGQHFREHYSYLKLRDRLSYAFALVSVATAVRSTATRSPMRALRSAVWPTSRGVVAMRRRRLSVRSRPSRSSPTARTASLRAPSAAVRTISRSIWRNARSSGRSRRQPPAHRNPKSIRR